MTAIEQMKYQLMCADYKAHQTGDPDDGFEAECFYNVWKALEDDEKN